MQRAYKLPKKFQDLRCRLGGPSLRAVPIQRGRLPPGVAFRVVPEPRLYNLESRHPNVKRLNCNRGAAWTLRSHSIGSGDQHRYRTTVAARSQPRPESPPSHHRIHLEGPSGLRPWSLSVRSSFPDAIAGTSLTSVRSVVDLVLLRRGFLTARSARNSGSPEVATSVARNAAPHSTSGFAPRLSGTESLRASVISRLVADRRNLARFGSAKPLYCYLRFRADDWTDGREAQAQARIPVAAAGGCDVLRDVPEGSAGRIAARPDRRPAQGVL